MRGLRSQRVTLGFCRRLVSTTRSALSRRATCVVARFVVGPLGDVYGSVKVQTALLAFCGICTFFAGFVNSLAELCLMRFLIGVGGATFVITQLWSSEMFAKNVVGAANAMTGGWGNCGGGMAIMIMGYIYEGFRDEGMSQENAWRRSFYIPAVAAAPTRRRRRPRPTDTSHKARLPAETAPHPTPPPRWCRHAEATADVYGSRSTSRDE